MPPNTNKQNKLLANRRPWADFAPERAKKHAMNTMSTICGGSFGFGIVSTHFEIQRPAADVVF